MVCGDLGVVGAPLSRKVRQKQWASLVKNPKQSRNYKTNLYSRVR